jgi:hypothetical protein
MVWRRFLCILGRPFSSKEKKRAAELARQLAAQDFSRDDRCQAQIFAVLFLCF